MRKNLAIFVCAMFIATAAVVSAVHTHTQEVDKKIIVDVLKPNSYVDFDWGPYDSTHGLWYLADHYGNAGNRVDVGTTSGDIAHRQAFYVEIYDKITTSTITEVKIVAWSIHEHGNNSEPASNKQPDQYTVFKWTRSSGFTVFPTTSGDNEIYLSDSAVRENLGTPPAGAGAGVKQKLELYFGYIPQEQYRAGWWRLNLYVTGAPSTDYTPTPIPVGTAKMWDDTTLFTAQKDDPGFTPVRYANQLAPYFGYYKYSEMSATADAMASGEPGQTVSTNEINVKYKTNFNYAVSVNMTQNLYTNHESSSGNSIGATNVTLLWEDVSKGNFNDGGSSIFIKGTGNPDGTITAYSNAPDTNTMNKGSQAIGNGERVRYKISIPWGTQAARYRANVIYWIQLESPQEV